MSLGSGTWLPSTRHAKDLIEHAREHAKLASEKDLKIGLVHIDNAVETLLKEHLRYSKEKKWEEVVDMGFYKLLDECKELNPVKDNKSRFLAFHDLRNAVYHFGTLTPSKEDVEAAISHGELLFNALHPEHAFAATKVLLPSEKALENLSEIRPSPYVSEVHLIKKFSNYLRKKGYKIEIEARLPSGAIVDLMASRKNELYIFEFKTSSEESFIGKRALYQLLGYLAEAKMKYPKRTVKGILISNTKFTINLKKIARTEGVMVVENGRISGLRLHYRRKKSYPEPKKSQLDFIIQRFQEKVSNPIESNWSIRILHPTQRIEKCTVLCNGVPCPWWDKDESYFEHFIFKMGGGNVRLALGSEMDDAEIIVKDGKKTLRKLSFKDIPMADR